MRKLLCFFLLLLAPLAINAQSIKSLDCLDDFASPRGSAVVWYGATGSGLTSYKSIDGAKHFQVPVDVRFFGVRRAPYTNIRKPFPTKTVFVGGYYQGTPNQFRLGGDVMWRLSDSHFFFGFAVGFGEESALAPREIDNARRFLLFAGLKSTLVIHLFHGVFLLPQLEWDVCHAASLKDRKARVSAPADFFDNIRFTVPIAVRLSPLK